MIPDRYIIKIEKSLGKVLKYQSGLQKVPGRSNMKKYDGPGIGNM